MEHEYDPMLMEALMLLSSDDSDAPSIHSSADANAAHACHAAPSGEQRTGGGNHRDEVTTQIRRPPQAKRGTKRHNDAHDVRPTPTNSVSPRRRRMKKCTYAVRRAEAERLRASIPQLESQLARLETLRHRREETRHQTQQERHRLAHAQTENAHLKEMVAVRTAHVEQAKSAAIRAQQRRYL